jgi:hypothetical protein
METMIAASDNDTYPISVHAEKDAAEKLDGSTPIHAFETIVVHWFEVRQV